MPSGSVQLGLTLIPLPTYSPDLNPIENLWRWIREELTLNHGHLSKRHLFEAFKDCINAYP